MPSTYAAPDSSITPPTRVPPAPTRFRGRAGRCIGAKAAARLRLPYVGHFATIPPDRASGVCLRVERAEPPPAERSAPSELSASQVLEVAEREIAWFFADASDEPASVVARAQIGAWLGELDDAERQTLELGCDPTPWPRSIRDEGRGPYTLTLSFVYAGTWRPEGSPRTHAEAIAAEQLEDAVWRRGRAALRHVERRVRHALRDAVFAYAKARGRAPSVVPAS
jgi:hypothetical protein